MQVTETKNHGLVREYKVALPAAEIGGKLDARLNELARTIKLPGFRPGKVPMTLVRQRFGPALRGEVLEQAISESSQAVIKERNLRPAGTPKLEISAYDDQGDLEYSLAVEVLPEVVPPDYSQIALERLVAEPTDEDIDESLRRLARGSRNFTDVTEERGAETGDLVIVNFVGPADRKAFAGDDGREVPIEVGDGGPLPGVGEQLAGARVGERRPLSVSFPADYASQALRGHVATYEIEVVGLRSAPPVAVDDGLAKSFGFDTLEAMTAEVRRRRREELQALARIRLKRALLDRLDELYRFDLPEVLVAREYDSICRQLAALPDGVPATESSTSAMLASTVADESASAEQGHDEHVHDEHVHDEHVHDEHCGHDHDHDDGHDGQSAAAPPGDAPDAPLTEAQRTEYRALAERRVRLGLVLAEVGKQSQLKVTPEELSRAIIAEARRFPGQEKDVIAYFRQHAGAREALAAPILEDKVVDYIVELATVTERTVSPDDLLRAVEEAPISTA